MDVRPKRKGAGSKLASLLDVEKSLIDSLEASGTNLRDTSTPKTPLTLNGSQVGRQVDREIQRAEKDCEDMSKKLQLLKLEHTRLELQKQIEDEQAKLSRMERGRLDTSCSGETCEQSKLKTLHIVDYIWEDFGSDSVEIAVGIGDAKINLGKKRTKLADVTIQQWGYANARIMQELLKQGRLMVIDAYVKYTADTFRLASRYTWSSVLAYDHEYRERQSAEQFQWGTYLQELRDFRLVSKAVHNVMTKTNSSSADNQRRKGPFTPSGLEICRNYNRGNCTRQQCKLSHRCSICYQGHPEVSHLNAKNEPWREQRLDHPRPPAPPHQA